ncbi:PhzF family phenazine biosynthesis protein [Mesorhizobium sp. UC74_2]|jgi:PhzF family phenazine biosynthesis protein|uniref:PhzF family phenazine biosynthesis protein n=2 Tax=unclassified Mesorhizobium TaxID=325217 RepID=UPI00366FC032
MSLPFAIIDVFAASPLEGNPLAVVDGGDELPDDRLAAIAGEFNLVETTFVMRATHPDATLRLRSFTAAGHEVFGAGGHNSLGAWLWLAQSGRLNLRGARTDFTQEIGGQLFPLSIDATPGQSIRVTMAQSHARWGNQVKDYASLAASFGLAPDAIHGNAPPVQVVDTGAGHLMVALKDRKAVDAARPDVQALGVILRQAGGEGCYVYSLDPSTPNTVAYARFFNPTMGIGEDPATGTAAGPLAAHLVRHGFASPGRIVIEQGRKLGRPSLIEVEIDGLAVRISASGVMAAEGKLWL